jgi:hypothetical protein
MKKVPVNASTVSRALQWVIDYLDEFSPFVPGKGFQYPEGKKVAHTGDTSSPQVQKILTFLEEVQARRDFADTLLRSPMSFVLHCDLYAVLRSLGREDLTQRALLQRTIDKGLLDHYERSPFRMMDVRVSLDMGGFRSSWPSVDELYESTSTFRSLNALHLDEASIYVLTHAIMFLYYYGTRPDAPADPPDDTQVRLTLANLLISMCQGGHWDLLGELLICWDCMGLPDETVYRKAWAAFLTAQAQDGSFQALRNYPTYQSEEVVTTPASEREAYFDFRYHTTVVGIIAGSLRMSRHDNGRIAGPAVAPERASLAPAYQKPLAHADLEAVTGAFQQAGAWLYQLLESSVDAHRHSTHSLLYLLLGIWTCKSFLNKAEGVEGAERDGVGLHSAAKLVWKSLTTGKDSAITESLLGIPPTLTLAVSAILSSEGSAVPGLQAFLQAVAGVLEKTPDDEALTQLSLCEKRVLLHALGVLPLPRLVTSSELEVFVQSLPPTATFDQIEDLLLYANSCAAYGMHEVNGTQHERWLGDFLSGLAAHFLGQYDLSMGCKLLRSISYLGFKSHPGLSSCVKFLCFHQRPNGAFGFLGPEELRLRAELPHFDEELDLYLPTTVSCLLALAEAAPTGWRMFKALGQL